MAVELYSRLWLGKAALVGGFEDYVPRDLSPLINPNFKARYAILGAEYHFSPSGYTFFEARVGDTRNAEGRGGYTLQRSVSAMTLVGRRRTYSNTMFLNRSLLKIESSALW